MSVRPLRGQSRGSAATLRRSLHGGWISGVVHALLLTALAHLTLALHRSGPPIELRCSVPPQDQQRREIMLELPISTRVQEGLVAGSEAVFMGGGIDLPTLQISAPATAGPRPRDRLGEVERLANSSRGGYAHQDRGNSAEFFGILAAGKRFVFVVDCSLSMTGQKWRDACQELIESIERLDESQSFYVFLFDGQSHPMFAPAPPEPDLLPARPDNVARFRQWLASVQLGYNTSPCRSIKQACQLRPDAIFLLSDGEFSDPTAAYLRSNNRIRASDSSAATQIAVHTVCFYSQDGHRMLQRIADENGGRCSIIGASGVP